MPFRIYRFKYLLLFALTAFMACENSEAELEERLKTKISVDEAKEVETFFSQAGKVKAKLTAPLMYRYQDTLPRVEFPEKLHVDFYNDSLEVESKLDALYGRYIEGQNKVLLRDSVIVINILKRDTLRCEELWWDQNKQMFFTDKPVLVSQGDGTVLPGMGLEASQDFKSWKILKPANGTYYWGGDPFASFDSAQAPIQADSTLPAPAKDTSAAIPD